VLLDLGYELFGNMLHPLLTFHHIGERQAGWPLSCAQ
jgi:hypothetical protein